jgi:quercetin dioxygenase-like cupin family protein
MQFKRFDAYELTYQRGDGMGIHEHDYDHYIIVLAGAVMLLADDGSAIDGITATPNTRVVFPAGRRHGWTALEDHTVVLGIYPQNARSSPT